MEINIIWIVIMVGVLVVLVSIISQLRSDVLRMQRTLDRIGEQVGLPDIVTKEEKERLINLILDGKEVKAIKDYRILTGLGLKEAKEYIDNLKIDISMRKNIKD
ncbi:ribosomal protein L7/L12 [Clostridium sp. B9]|uniref:ribosomal protein L7/L12 n=1 Tax=Clostridium sp. B9 TaxID=3423224 RepID=UPI003D2EE30C